MPITVPSTNAKFVDEKVMSLDKYTLTLGAESREAWETNQVSRTIIKKSTTSYGDHFNPTAYGVVHSQWKTPVSFGPRKVGSWNASLFPESCPYFPNSIYFVTNAFAAGGSKISYNGNRYTQLVTEALAKFTGDNINIGATLAESVETADYLARKAGSVFKMLRAIKTGNLGQLRKSFRRMTDGRRITAGRVARTASARWLEWRYAVLPLVYDTDAAFQIMKEGIQTRRNENRPWELLVSKTVKYSDQVKTTYGSSYVQNQFYTAALHCKIYATVDDSAAHAAAALGLEPVGALWELVPFSFVIDWAVPIGTFIQALNATDGLTFSRGYVNQRTFTHLTVDPIHSSFDYVTNGTGWVRTFLREPLPRFPVPGIYHKSPFSTKNNITALALFTSLTVSPEFTLSRGKWS